METRHINPFQLARRWGITPKTLQNWRCKHRGPPFLKIGGHVLYRQDDIAQFEANNYHKFKLKENNHGFHLSRQQH